MDVVKPSWITSALGSHQHKVSLQHWWELALKLSFCVAFWKVLSGDGGDAHHIELWAGHGLCLSYVSMDGRLRLQVDDGIGGNTSVRD